MSPEAKNLLRGLKEQVGWKEILGLIRESKVPVYKPMRSSGDSKTLSVEVQERNWIFFSGRVKERDYILNLLTGENNEHASRE